MIHFYEDLYELHAALIAGFAVVVLTNVNFPPNIDATLLVLVGFVTAGVVSLSLSIAYCNMTYIPS